LQPQSLEPEVEHFLTGAFFGPDVFVTKHDDRSALVAVLGVDPKIVFWWVVVRGGEGARKDIALWFRVLSSQETEVCAVVAGIPSRTTPAIGSCGSLVLMVETVTEVWGRTNAFTETLIHLLVSQRIGESEETFRGLAEETVIGDVLASAMVAVRKRRIVGGAKCGRGGRVDVLLQVL